MSFLVAAVGKFFVFHRLVQRFLYRFLPSKHSFDYCHSWFVHTTVPLIQISAI